MPTAPEAPGTERRKFPRKNVIGSGLISVDVEPQVSSALLVDISEGGFALQNLKAMDPGDTRDISFRLPDTVTKIKMSAIVVWTDGERAGLRVLRMEDSTPALTRWIQTLPDIKKVAVNSVPVVHPDSIATQVELRDEDFYSFTARARVVTCATGAAIAWEDSEGMVCRASTGVAPGPGARVQLDQGLSGECFRTAAVVRCDDTESDGRVDPEVCRQLNLRSALIVPVLSQGKVMGLIEVFSNRPNAFRAEDIAGLRLLADQCSAGQSTLRTAHRATLHAGGSQDLAADT